MSASATDDATIEIGVDDVEPRVAISRLADEFSRRAGQFDLAVDDLSDHELQAIGRTRAEYRGRARTFRFAASALHDLANDLEGETDD